MIPCNSLVVLASWLALISPTNALEIPPYTGKYNVGAKKHVIAVNNQFILAPENVSDSFLVTLFYPTLQEPSIPGTTTYWPEGLATVFESSLQIPNGTFANLTDRIIWEAPFADSLKCDEGHISTTLLFQGAFGSPPAEGYTIMLSNLASHGYTIAAMDLPYEQPYLLYPDGREFYVPSGAYNMTDLLASVIENRINNTLSFMKAWPKLSSKLKIKSSTHRFGAFGHSVGGMVALSVAQMVDQRVIPSGINLDGEFSDTNLALNSSAADIKRPSLLLSSQPHNTSIDPTWATYPEWQSSWLRWININGTAHYDFSDFTFLKNLYPSNSPNALATGNITTSRMVDITNTFLSGFFNWTLLEQHESSVFNDPAEAFPEAILFWDVNSTLPLSHC